MKQLLVSGMLLLLSAFAYAKVDMTVAVDPQDPSFVVTLPANPSTGYQWVAKDYDQRFLKLEKKEYIAKKTDLVGAGGQTKFTFVFKDGSFHPKKTLIKFSYERPWEKDQGTIKKVLIKFESSYE